MRQSEGWDWNLHQIHVDEVEASEVSKISGGHKHDLYGRVGRGVLFLLHLQRSCFISFFFSEMSRVVSISLYLYSNCYKIYMWNCGVIYITPVKSTLSWIIYLRLLGTLCRLFWTHRSFFTKTYKSKLLLLFKKSSSMPADKAVRE